MSAERGEGQNSSMTVEATTPPHSPTSVGGTRTDGEFPGAGSRHSATLNERMNKSNTRNRGPMRDPGAIGGARLPSMRMTSRRTGQTGSVSMKRRG